MALHIRQLTKVYPGAKRPALNHVSLDVAEGELFFLLGPSGCGKTTLLRLIGGFEQPTEGMISNGSENITARPANERNTAMVFQGYALWPHMTVAQNIAFGLEMQGLPQQEIANRTAEAMRQMQIESYAQRRPNQLSGGQQQRVALARTLVVHPEYLLLDEPLANLDAKLRRDMRMEIRRICHDNHLTGIYVTHDRAEALSMADRIAVMKDGVIVQIGTPIEIYRHPVNAFVATFLGETNLLKGQLISWNHERTMARIDTPAGILRCANVPATIAEKSDVLLSIRPEALQQLPESDSRQDNVINVTLVQQEYLGESLEDTGRVDDGSLIRFYETNPVGMRTADVKLQLYVREEDIVYLQE